MASRVPKLYITTYRHMALDDFSKVISAPMTPPLSEAYVEITYESIASDPFPQYTTFICIRAEADCAIAFGADPIADPDYHVIMAGERLFYGVTAGSKIAVIEVL